ncbi:hypothetical protein FSARC_13002 [Fusarium sarcochroum]|uniref:AAA+ ATPase domain-containing protein n=1 Tax=Fusarium sarcochroum TaxID=1208366 RepID=A0A8H4T4E4_9HYPO|nr:hypothetical protein FSARC_13002 [Fusarium sarcochroum]
MPRQTFDGPRVITHNNSRNLAPPMHDAIEDCSVQASMTQHDSLPSQVIDSEVDEDESDLESQRNEARTRRRLPMMVDWRREICSFLNKDDMCTDNEIRFELETVSERLREFDSLRRLALAHRGPPRVQVINQTECQSSKERGLYLDKPWVVDTGPHHAHLRCSKRIDNLQLCCGNSRPVPNTNHSEEAHEIDVSSLRVSESISIVSDELKGAWEELIAKDDQLSKQKTRPGVKNHENQDTRHPYLWWFHHRQDIISWTTHLDPESRKHVGVFQSYLSECLDREWATVDALLSRNKITAQYLNYIFAPGQIVISTLGGTSIAQLQAYTTTDWLSKNHLSTEDRINASINASHWQFDGHFQKYTAVLPISHPCSMTEEFSINALPVYPIQYAVEDVVLALRARGEMFWKCRHRNYVCVLGTPEDHLYDAYSGSRFMIDTATYKQMHPRANNIPPPVPYYDDLGPELMAQDDPPPELGDEFYMCLPTSLNGFNMQKKEWVKLDVAYLREVTWNKEAFELLVMEPGTKELVEAVVTNHVDEDRNTDVIHGKGNGLFILLHGGPGTGKTLTAESVAEITKKPLYRVTCGDIGTKAEEVERYLEVVLLLGKTWGCVVLLDEADVFLEQRKLDNLDRNALVSVFLRVLEYYDGILILTSNRVGIFDEAFKSRIQLNLRYENLDRPQRRKIWENFINRLERLELERGKQGDVRALVPVPGGPQSAPLYGVDIKNIRKHLDKLSEPSLNGREIRNMISTARQLATFRKQMLGCEHLETCITEAHKFEEYIKTLKKGFTADQIKKTQQER